MKLAKKLKGVSDARKSAPSIYRDPLPMVRRYQQEAIDKARNRDAVVATPPTAAKTTLPPVPPATVLSTMAPPASAAGEDDAYDFAFDIGKVAFKASQINETTIEDVLSAVATVMAEKNEPFTDAMRQAARAHFLEMGRVWGNTVSRNRARREASKDPVTAKAAGVGYNGPVLPDKGLQDGSCNRTACQMPLAGKRQFFMRDYLTGGRLHYCGDCGDLFDADDRKFGDPRRCTELTPENRA